MTSKSDLEILLSRLAENFERAAQSWQDRGVGWGQFLNAPKEHSQVGPYGTCAGVIVLTLAGRGQSSVCQEAGRLLSSWWLARNENTYEQKRFAQTLRLALLNLVARLSQVASLRGISSEVESELIRRRLPSGEWGNWWISDRSYDPTPSIVTTSIAILSLLLFREEPEDPQISSLLEEAGAQLRKRLESSSQLSSLEMTVATAALLCCQALRKASGNHLASRTLRMAVPEPQYGIFFFFYEHATDKQGRSIGRDYLLIPVELLVAIAGFQTGATGTMRLIATEIVDGLNNKLASGDGSYKVSTRDHVSSLDQCWAAIAIESALKARETGERLPGRLSRTWYFLAKQREGNILTDTIFPITALVIFIVVNTVPGIESTLVKIFAALGLTLVASIWGDDILKRMFPGRR